MNALHLRIHSILLHDWDPIGIVELQGPDDEYDSYIDEVSALLANGHSTTSIASTLMEIEQKRMGLPGRHERAMRVAQMLQALHFE